MHKKNCWEIVNCLKDKCPAHYADELDSINEGTCGGRICWLVPNTDCERHCYFETLDEKMKCCSCCPVYNKIKKEEGIDFVEKVEGYEW